MNDVAEAPKIDFQLDPQRGRYMLFFKRPKGTPIPSGRWRCICGTEHVITGMPVQFCPTCGSRLHHQEEKEESRKRHTKVVVTHCGPGR